jgi:MFS family permease
MVSPMERPRYQSYTSIMFMAASVIGPVIGGVFTDYVHWTMIFWINLPMGLLALWMTDRALKKLPRHDRPHRLDVPGALLMVSAALSLMLAMSWGGTRYGWASAPVLGLLAGSALLWVSFGARVATAPEPFIPLSVLREPIVGFTAAAGFFAVGVIIGLTIFLPLYFELVLGFSPTGSGTALIVFLAAATVGSFFAGRLMVRLTHYKVVPLGGMALGVLALAAFAWKPGGLSLFDVCVLLTVGGSGLGVMYPVTTTIVQNSVQPHQLGTATGALNFARQLGGAIIVAAFAAIVLGGIDTGGHGLTLDRLRGAAYGPGGAAAQDFTQNFTQVFRWLFAAGAVFLGAGLIAVAAIRERPLRGPQRES